jgi:hypothetical protein
MDMKSTTQTTSSITTKSTSSITTHTTHTTQTTRTIHTISYVNTEITSSVITSTPNKNKSKNDNKISHIHKPQQPDIQIIHKSKIISPNEPKKQDSIKKSTLSWKRQPKNSPLSYEYGNIIRFSCWKENRYALVKHVAPSSMKIQEIEFDDKTLKIGREIEGHKKTHRNRLQLGRELYKLM